MMRENLIHNSLERILLWLQREAPHLASSLQPGLSSEQMLQIMGSKNTQYRLPREIVELYSWRNGQSEQAPFFNVLRFQPFEDAVAYGNLVGPYFDGVFPLMLFQELDYDAGYQVRCGREEQTSAPAYRWEHGDEYIETPSLTDLLAAVAEAFEAEAFHPNQEGMLETDEELWNTILLRRHSDRLRFANALLHRQWEELNTEHLRAAFADLVRMKHPDTAALVREYLGGKPAGPTQGFDAFYAVLSTGIAIQDEWTRDYALNQAFAGDPRRASAALTSLAWSWRGDLPLSAEQVDRLLDMIRADATDHNNRECAMLLEISGDRRAIPVLLELIDGPSADSVARDTQIAALRALGRLKAVEARQICLSVANSSPDPGTRISAVATLVDLGFEDASVENSAKAYFREMLLHFETLSLKDENSTLRRWMDEVRQSHSS